MIRQLIVCSSALLVVSTGAFAQSPGGTAALRTDIFALIERLSDEMNREFVVDGASLNSMAGWSTAGDDADYDTLQALLRGAGMATIEVGDQIRIIPSANMRSEPSQILQEDDRRVSDHTIVTRVIAVDRISPAQLVPILRPMMPQEAQLGAVSDTNSLIIIDRYDNVRRITQVIDEIIDQLPDE
jgi:general secretion pathway protein D